MSKGVIVNVFKKLALCALCGTLASFSAVAQGKPNIVLLYIDDWAWNGTPVAMDDSMENSACLSCRCQISRASLVRG